MQRKDMAYSCAQLTDFLGKMRHVERVSSHEFRYKGAHITLIPQDVVSHFGFKRCFMELSGVTDDCAHFYRQFLLHYMTMGG